MSPLEGAPFTLRGAGSVSGVPDRPALQLELVRVDRSATFVPPARGEAAARTAEVKPDDLIEIEFAGGERLWMRADEYRARFGGFAPARDAGGREVVDVPPALQFVPAPLQTRDTRGAAGWVVKSLKVIGIDLAGRTARQIAAHVEEKTQPGGRRPGLDLFRCRLETGAFGLDTPETSPRDGKPWLLFVHGTGSSTWGSFGELWSAARRDQLVALRAVYGDRVLAFEHRSLTESPIRNALDLVRKLDRILPDGAPLHLVTHSRGGLVGELLCRSGVTGEAGGAQPRPFDDEEIGLFKRDAGPRRDPDLRFDPEDFKLLTALGDALQGRRFEVQRFVRVACPALGTTLASGRLDRWLSVIGTLAGLLPANPVADAFADLGDFVAAVVKERTDPRTLPGLQAMMPDAHCVKLANWPEKAVSGDLAVIAGDIDPAKWWARLAVWLTDRFYEGDHDLVVNTPSMYGGARRTGRAAVSFHKADTVNHFTYFREPSSAERLVTALTARDGQEWPGFEPLHPPTVSIARAATRSAKPQPTVFVLPGIMGSELSAGDRSIWINPLQLLRGGLLDLALDAPDIRASKPVERYYGRICEHLSATHHVVPFAYDWRRGIDTEADTLADAVRDALAGAKGRGQPVRFLAHSMGGLVVRAMIARHEPLWRELAAHPDSRFVMLGTPNGGSYAIAELIVGQSVVFRKLARLDIAHRAEELLRTIVKFPGILAMLPAFPDGSFFSAETWAAFHARSGAGWVPPDVEDLESARAARRLLDSSPLAAERMIYVAGSSDVTVAGMRLESSPGDKAERIVFTGTTRGDGRVTWDTGIPPSLPVYYMDVQHGDLAAYEPAFPALEELLQRGETRLLPRTPPVSRATAATFDMPPAEDDRYPDRDDLTAAVLGAGTRARAVPRARAERPVNVSVVHGNLAFTRYPVAVGHYAGDTIVSAEKHLDRALQGALTHRLHLGLYPGPMETNAVFTNPRLAQDRYARPGGAIVVGLGAVGALTASSLTRSFERALLEYVLERRKSSMPGSEESGRGIGISTLLIGTGAGGMSVTDSVFALVRGARQANQALGAAERDERIAELEVIELYEDRAILALEALDRLSKRPGVDAGFTLKEGLSRRDGGLQRVSYDDEAPEWWHRLQVSGVEKGGDGRNGGLRFAAVTRRARTEVTLLPTQRAVVDQFVQGTLETTRHDAGVARTLFDLLLPNELKDSAPDQDNLVLLVDEESARYPWELLEDSRDHRRTPFVVDHGLLRQLESSEYRAVVRATAELSALVIGDPISPYVELKGAQMEAEAVSRALTPRFSSVTTRVRPRSQDVVTAVFDRPFKVLHLAGHGVYRYPVGTAGCTACGQPLPASPTRSQAPQTVTGMVIGDGVYLTPAEIAQMRTVPDLVFINCCHLGRVEADRAHATPQEHAFPRLAANLASEFIRMGVRAVIAAGWAVEDEAASTFAVTFYESMLKGETFGEAVKTARQATYRGHPASNTWGAYQCYGDPDFRLVLTRETERREEDPVFLSPAHALRDIGNVAARLKTRSSEGKDDEVRRLESIVRVLEAKGWRSQGMLLAALARAFREAGELERAIGYYCDALGADDGAVTARDVEQWANLIGRVAVARWRRDPGNESLRTEGIRDLERSIGVLRDVLGGGEQGERLTAERLALIGSAYKRLAWIDPAGRKAALDRAAEYYRRATDKARERGNELARHLLNMRWTDIARRWQEETAASGMPAGLVSDLAAVRAQIADDEKRNGPEFWQDSMRIDCELLEIIFEGAPPREKLIDIGSRYQDSRRHASAREFASVCDQLDFLVAMAEGRMELAEGLAELRRRMTASASGAQP